VVEIRQQKSPAKTTDIHAKASEGKRKQAKRFSPPRLLSKNQTYDSPVGTRGKDLSASYVEQAIQPVLKSLSVSVRLSPRRADTRSAPFDYE